MGVFIEISLDQSRIAPDVAQKVARVCPVDIYAVEDGELVVRPVQEDECILCRLCLENAPAGAIRILKTYSGETLVSEARP